MLFTYNPKEIAVTLKGSLLSGFAKGTFINVELDDDDWSLDQGTDGQVLRSRKANSVATVTLTLQQSSLSNDVLTGMRNIDRANGEGTGTFLLKDTRGTTLISAPFAFINKPTALGFADEATNRDWKISLVDVVFNAGGNFPNI
jgi:hypothetical protein